MRIKQLHLLKRPELLEYHKRKKLEQHGMTLEDYEIMERNQNGLCAICHKPETHRRNSRLSIDHNHTTNRIRGLLCSRCNKCIGMLEDNIQYLENAIEYLKN